MPDTPKKTRKATPTTFDGEPVTIRLSKQQRSDIERVAHSIGSSISTWARVLMLREVKKADAENA
jgi:hypothetical protein